MSFGENLELFSESLVHLMPLRNTPFGSLAVVVKSTSIFLLQGGIRVLSREPLIPFGTLKYHCILTPI